MADTQDDDEIIVTGPRLKATNESNSNSGGGSGGAGGGNFLPSRFFNCGALQPVGGTLDSPFSTPILDIGEDQRFDLPGVTVDLIVPEDTWQKLTPNQRWIVTQIVKNATNDPNSVLTKAIEHADKHQVASIVLHVENFWVHNDGTVKSWDQAATMNNLSAPPRALVVYESEPGNIDRTDIVNGTSIHVWMRESYVSTATPSQIATTFIHELMHPWAPDDQYDPSTNRLTDHHHITQQAMQAANALFSSGFSPPVASINPDEGVLMVGASAGDNLMGGSDNDVLGGLAGNDVLNGGAGSDALYGGTGMDTLLAGGTNDYLSGGLDADTYFIGQGAEVAEIGGVDCIHLNGYLESFAFKGIEGGHLVIYPHDDLNNPVAIVHSYFGSAGRVEVFETHDGAWAASHIDELANGGSGGGDPPWYEEPHVTPVFLDLGGDGLNFLTPEESRVRWDVDGDGSRDRVAWVDGSDGVLVFDRDGDGRVSDLSEFSFTGDFRGAATDLEGLLGFDDNRDGRLDTADAVFGSLLIWIDADEDGRSQRKEMLTLADLGIVNIGLEVFDRSALDRGNPATQILGFALVETTYGELRAFDVALEAEPRAVGSQVTPSFTVETFGNWRIDDAVLL